MYSLLQVSWHSLRGFESLPSHKTPARHGWGLTFKLYSQDMTNIILVAGTYLGGWYYEPIVPALQNAGHNTFPVTLSGLDPETPHPLPINLDTHINDILRVINTNNLSEVVLVGHSYGGMPITGAADRTTAEIRKLIYLDAQVPKPGQREWDLMLEKDRIPPERTGFDGLTMHPEEWLLELYPRMQPHPLATKLQMLNYDQTKFDSLDKVFVYCTEWFRNGDVSPFLPIVERLKTEPGWTTFTWNVGHDTIGEAAEKVIELILAESS